MFDCQRQVFSALAQMSKHCVDIAEMVVEAEIFPSALYSLKDNDDLIRKNCATLIREICKHSQELSQLIVNSGGVAALVDYICSTSENVRLPGVIALGYIGAHSEVLAMSVIVSKGVIALKQVINEEQEDHLQAAAAWSLGQIGRHTPEHAKAVAEANLFPLLLDGYLRPTATEELQIKTKKALKQILQKCVHLEALEPLLNNAPPKILKHVLAQFSKVLPHNSTARRLFVTSGSLKKVQDLKVEPGSAMAEYIHAINNCYPEEVVKYYSPGYSETLLERVESYQIPT